MRRKAGGRRRSWFLQQWLSAREMFRRRRAGYVLMLTAFLIPVVLAAVNYTLKLIERSHSSLIKTSSSTAVGQAVLLAYNPAKKWSDQKAKVYSAGAQALNDRAFNLKKSMTFTAVPTTVFVASSPKNVSGFTLVKMYLALSSYGLTHLNNSNTHFHQHTTFADKPVTEDDKYKTLLCDDAPLDAISFNPNGTLSFSINSVLDSGTKYKEIFYDPALKINTDILETSLDTANNFIKCHCKSLGKAAKAYPAKCDVDIILTIPTNHAACTSDNSNTGALIAPNGTSSTPIVEIARSYAHFLRENFLHTIGVAVGVVPYSAKISVPPDRSDWTVNILPLSKAPSKPYIKQAVAYGTDGEEGGEIVNSSVQYEWGEATIGFPIMFRRGTRSAGYRDVNINEGILLSVDSPSSDANKFQRMNTNPCYLGHCNLLALACEKTCPTYMANPYFITELTDDVQKVIYDLGLLRPINDTKNKSNFLFLAVQWAHNLLSSWTNHPASSALTGEKFTHTARASKKHAVIIIVNAPDHFEHGELTYLGFSNDNSEIPMYESDMIPFSEGITVGGKGIIRYSGAGAYDSDSKSFEIAGADKEGTLTFPEKGVIKLVVALANPSITFYDDNKVDSYSNNGTTYAPSSSGTKHDLSSEQTFEFSGPTRLYDLSHNSKNIYEVSSTGGENFGHNLSIYKLKYKLKSAEITSGTLKNQILRAYAHYNLNGVDSSAKAIITSSTSSGDRAGAVQNAEHEKYIDPCIDLNDGCHNETTGWIFSGGNNCQVKAYNFHPKCHGVTNGKFVMTASWGGSPQVDNALVRCKNSSGSESWPLIGAIINGNVYNVFNFHPSGYSAYTDGVTQVFTGRFSAKSKETFRLTGSSTFKCRVWSRKADPGKNTYQQNVCSDSYGNAISVRYDCTSGSSTWCLCSDCGAHNYYPAGGWSYDNVENEYTYSNKNLEHIDGTATKATFYPGTTSSCYKTYDENGNETDSNCDRMTGAGCSYETSGEWTGGDVQDCNPNVEWSETPYEIEYEHCIRYDLNNFFFVNNDSKSYNAAATKTDIVQNKCIGKLDNNGSWICFCGDGQLTLKVKPTKGSLKFTNITTSSSTYTMFSDTRTDSLSNNTSYTLNEYGNTVFYLAPDQISNSKDANGNYQVKFKMTGLKIISAEITNRPTESITPICSLSGTTDALGKTNQTAVITTNMKAALTIKAKTQNLCNVTFYKDNEVDSCTGGATIGTSYTLAEEKTFTFSGPTRLYDLTHNTKNISEMSTTGGSNFGHNLSIYKLKYKLENAEITSGTLSNQILRAYAHYNLNGVDSSAKAIITSSTSSNDRAGAVQNATSEQYIDPCIDLNDGHYDGTDGWVFSGSNYCQINAYNFHPACWGVISGKFIMTAYWGGTFITTDNATVNCKNSSGGADWPSMGAILNGNAYNVFSFPPSGCSALSNSVTRVFSGRFKYKSSEKMNMADKIACAAGSDSCGNSPSSENTCYSTKNTNHFIKVKFSDSDPGRNVATKCDITDRTYDDWTFLEGTFDSVDNGCYEGCQKYVKFTKACVNYFKTSGEKETSSTCKDGFDTEEYEKISSPFRYDLNNFFFVNNDSKSYNAAATKTDIVQNKCIGKLDNNGTWICFCGDGQLTLSVKPTGSVSGTIAYKNASNASASTSVTNLSYVTININPSTHLYEPQGDGSYKITLTLTNVQVSTQKMSDTKEVIRHSHPDVVADKLENVRIVDFNTNPPKHYGSILFGEDESGTLTAHGHSYSLIDHLKYWVTNSGWNHFYHKGVIGDWFAILLDYGNVLPSIKWFLNGDSNYNAAYSFSGLHRSFFPWGAFENREGIFASFDITNAKSTALIFGGYTLPLNYMLCNSGYQTPATAATAVDQDNAVAKVTDDACSKLKSSDNTRVYVIKYRIADSNLGNSSKAALEKCAYGASSPYTQTVSTEADLIAALQEIADDIKTFADRKDYHVDE